MCVCDRPHLLPEILGALQAQTLAGTLTVFVADNGSMPAKPVLDAQAGRLDIVYRRVATPGISTPRNTVLREAVKRGFGYAACLDDDEVPAPDWLETLLSRARETNADLVGGRVEPRFAAGAPAWATSGLVFRKDGSIPSTANLLVRLDILPASPDDWFQPQFGTTGGEDRELLGRLIDNGARFATAAEAVVTEEIPNDRLRLRFMFRRGLRDGMVEVQILRLRKNAPLEAILASVGFAARKAGYGIDHLFWSLRTPGRIAQAVRDFGAVAGAVLGLAGIRLRIYGPSPGGE